MRLLKLELDNYIGIYNGSGLEHLEIDFSKCINKVVVIRGANGSGKSSLFKTIHPFSDTNYYLTPNVDARKRIVYQIDDNTVIDITYTYPDAGKGDGSRKPTTCDIFVNGVDMNSSRNVTTGRDIICDILDIDAGFLTLGQLSSEDRGLVDKKPSDRKKFINTKLAELDVYNDIYKRINKKSIELKGTVTALNNDIKNIGDINSIQSNIYLWEGQLEDLEETKLLLFKDMTECTLRMKDIFDNDDIDPNEEMAKLQYKQRQLESEMKLYEDCMNCSEEELSEYMHYKDKCETHLNLLLDQQSKLSKELSDINEKITDISIKIEALGDIKLLSQYKERIDQLKQAKEEFEKVCAEHGFFRYHEITAEEYDQTIKTYNLIFNMEQRIKSDYSDGELEDAVNVFIGNLELPNENEIQKAIDDMTDNLNDLSQLLNHQNFYKEQSKGISNIPKGCGYKNECPFVKSIVEANSKLMSDSEEEECMSSILAIKNDISHAKEELLRVKNINKCLSQINNLYTLELASKNSLLKFCKRTPRDINDDNDMVKCSILGNSWFDLDMQYFNDIRNSFILYKSYQNDISSLESKYSSLVRNEELLNYMTEQLDSLMNDKIEKNKTYTKISSEVTNYRSEVTNTANFIIEYQNKLSKKSNMTALKEEYDKVIKDIEQFSTKLDSYNELKSKFNDSKSRMYIIDNNQIPTIKQKISDSKYKIVLYNDYVDKYEKYSKEYEKIEVIKYCCSPTTGIQTVYAEMYMNKILGISNQLLSMFFGGEFVMQPFVINDKEFRMPVLGSGIMNDDISSMSTSQKCIMAMIISFALLSNASSIYKIIKIDEVDSPLDTINRSAFFQALDTLMNYLQFDQCVMISHNVELNMSNTDIIILRNDDPDLKIDGNIIFNLEDVK